MPFGNIRNWIIVLLIALIVLNAAMFLVYRQANPSDSLSLQAWAFLSSDAFKLVTIALFLPIISLFLERLFDVRKNLSDRLHEIKRFTKNGLRMRNKRQSRQVGKLLSKHPRHGATYLKRFMKQDSQTRLRRISD